MTEGGADKRAGMPERPRGAGDGIAEATGVERQADKARGEKAGEEAQRLMEEVLRRENMRLVSLLEEYQRLKRTS